MWIAVALLFVFIFALIGAGLAGGIFTIVLIPIVVIAAIVVGVTMMLRRPKSRPSRSPGTVGWAPTPGGAGGPGGGGGGAAGGQTPADPATPEDVLSERRGD